MNDYLKTTDNLNIGISIIEFGFMILASFYVYLKITNIKKVKINNILICIISSFIISEITLKVKSILDVYSGLVALLFFVTIINIINYKKEVSYSILMNILALAISYVIYILAVIINFVLVVLFKFHNDYIETIMIISIYFYIIYKLFNIKKLKYGISFIQRKIENSYYNILIINICVVILFLIIMIQNSGFGKARELGTSFIIFAISMFLTIKQSFDMYYKQNLLTKDLEETKAELESKKKEVEKLEKENLEFSKTSHSLAHKQKALEFKLNELLSKNVGKELEENVLKEELEDISKDLYREPQEIQLPKTDIPKVDDMLAYMQSQCIKNNIEFELQITGNIYYMINNLISENDLEILLADHIKDAIIAINYSENTNRSIMVRLGKIDGIYGVYIYDSGIEFTKEVLEKLGKEPITTHADDEGTGMGFMNTFDTLSRTKASLTIKEIGEPCKDNFTKVLIFRFDGKNEFKVVSYKENIVV